MAQSHAQVWIHLVFSTKNRKPWLQQSDFQIETFRMLAYHIKQTGCVCATVGGHVDHVHLLFGLSRTITIAKLVESVKVETSKWAKKTKLGSKLFCWQGGYGAFSVSQANVDVVVNYIKTQQEHHQKYSFKDEFRKLCEQHKIMIDERYVWD